MSITKTNCTIGRSIIKIDGTDVGLTSKEGARLTYEDTLVRLEGGQAYGLLGAHRDMVAARVAFDIMEHSLAQWKTVFDSSTAVSGSTLAVTARGTVTEHLFEVVGAGPSGASRRLWGTAIVRITGESKMSKDGYQVTPCEAEFIVDPSTNLIFTLVDTAASGTAPTIASYQEVTAAGSESTITDPDTDFAVTSSVQVTFSKAISPGEIKTGGKFQIIDITGGSPILYTIAYGETTGASDMTKVKLTPASSLTGSANAYKLTVAAGVEALDGTELAAGAHIDFTTPS